MTASIEDHTGTVSTGCRTITNLCFADDIDGLAGEEEELANLVECLDKGSTTYGMEISAETTKLMTNNTCDINTEIKVNGQKLETVTSFKYLGSVISDEGSKPEILSRIAQTTAALTRLKPVWNERNISLSSKIRRKNEQWVSFLFVVVPYPSARFLHAHNEDSNIRHCPMNVTYAKVTHACLRTYAAGLKYANN